jgi:hypothetical protein
MVTIPNTQLLKKGFMHWAKVDSTEYIDWSEAEILTLPKLKPSTKTISLRLPESMLEETRINLWHADQLLCNPMRIE